MAENEDEPLVRLIVEGTTITPTGPGVMVVLKTGSWSRVLALGRVGPLVIPTTRRAAEELDLPCFAVRRDDPAFVGWEWSTAQQDGPAVPASEVALNPLVGEGEMIEARHEGVPQAPVRRRDGAE